LNSDRAAVIITPCDVTHDGGHLLGVTAVNGVVQGKLLERPEVTLDPGSATTHSSA
jgi:hypothetical protein